MPKQMFQSMPIAFTQVKVVNTSENLLGKNIQIVNSLCQGE